MLVALKVMDVDGRVKVLESRLVVMRGLPLQVLMSFVVITVVANRRLINVKVVLYGLILKITVAALQT